MTAILFVGVFHFDADPAAGHAVEVEPIDVMETSCQAYLAALAQKLASFKPTHVLVEAHPSRDDETNEQYRAYLARRLELGPTELHQLAFRVAEASGLSRLHGVDELGPPMLFGTLQDYMANKDPEALAAFESLVASMAAEEAQAHATMSLKELLIRTNAEECERASKAAYLTTNAVGAGDSFIGADSTAAFWNRNFRMYANIQRHFASDARLIVIAGQAHTSVLKDFAHVESDVVVESALPYLRDATMTH